MIPRSRASLLLALCALPLILSAQYFTVGTDPASVRWNQIKTSHFRLIYPASMEPQARYLANAYEYGYKPVSASLDVKPRKWPVIFHNRTVISNAMVPYAPKRIEIFTMPPQDNYAQDWLDQLILHEYRHSAQYTSVDRGLTRALSYVFGQQAVPAVLGLFVPFWFIEGDAVVTETALSKSGRGRVPSFEMKLRSQFLEKGIFSYDKAVNGSFKDFIPDHYELGYLLVGMTRKQYGSEAWSRIMRKTGNIPLMMVPFSNTLYKETGYGKSRLYGKITSELQDSWISADKSLDTTAYAPAATRNSKHYINLTQPSVLDDRQIIARKSSIDDQVRIVIIYSTGLEEVIATPGTMTDDMLSAAGKLVCWTEVDRDPRWDMQKYSVIKLLNLETGQVSRVTEKTRYFSPDLSKDGQAIAAIEVDEENNSYLVILSPIDGRVIQKIPAEKDHFLGYPAWSPEGNRIAVIINSNQGKTIAIADTSAGQFEPLMPFSFTEISKPVFLENYILFTGAFTGIDNIFALDIKTKILYQVTSSRFGATDAAVSPGGDRLYYSNYTADGYGLVLADLEPTSWTAWNPDDLHRFELADTLAGQENFIFDRKDVPDSAYVSKPYRKGLNLFNFHSWAPISIDVDNMDFNPGVTLLSQNLMGTSFTTIGYEYDLNEETGKYILKYSYEGLYPAFLLNTDYGLRRGIYTDSLDVQTKYKYHELNLAGGVYVPLNWYVKSWLVGFQPFAGYTYKYLRMDPDSELKFRKDRYHSMDYRLFFYAQSRQSYRDLLPRWGQLLDINYKQTLFDSDTASSIFAAEMVLYFPGLFRHHGFKIYGGYQDRIVDNYNYSGLINNPRGYSGIYANKMFSGSVAYEFPVCYPDWHIGPILYLKRIKAAVFYDYALAFDHEPDINYQSLGADVTFDFHLFRLFAPLEAGLRTIYFPESQTVGFEFIYRMNLSY